MGIKLIAIAATTLVLSTGVNAAIISADWQNPGDNLVTRDTDSGLEWLDLTATANRNYNDISAKFGAGDEFESWRYASTTEVAGLWDAFGGDSNFYNGLSTENNGVFASFASYLGDLKCNDPAQSCATGTGRSQILTGEAAGSSIWKVSGIYDDGNPNKDFLRLHTLTYSSAQKFKYTGSALVRVSAVPVPSAVWLFGSGMLGLLGVARRKMRS